MASTLSRRPQPFIREWTLSRPREDAADAA